MRTAGCHCGVDTASETRHIRSGPIFVQNRGTSMIPIDKGNVNYLNNASP
jgi:hypothetical protein